MKVGLSGGIACGKSTVLSLFGEAGFSTLSSDAIVAKLYETDQALLADVRERFGKDVFDAEGKLVRKALGQRVFADDEAIAWLEHALHPRVGQYWQSALAAEPQKNWVVEIPLLFEKKLEKHFNYTLAITTHVNRQIARLMGKGFTEAHARLRMARQMPVEQKAKLADYVICNDGDLRFLRDQVKHLLTLLN